MGFKQWFESRYKGFERQFRQANPNMPKYVANQIYDNEVGSNFRRSLARPAGVKAVVPAGDLPTAAFAAGQTTQQSPTSHLPSQLLGTTGNFKDIQWGRKPVVINISPNDFDEATLMKMMYLRFGFRPVEKVRQDAARTMTQWELMARTKEGENEPVIMIRDGNKYQLLEGWHRTMAYLVYISNPSMGAPPDQIELIRKGDVSRVDFTRWKPVQLQAYVGQRVSAKI